MNGRVVVILLFTVFHNGILCLKHNRRGYPDVSMSAVASVRWSADGGYQLIQGGHQRDVTITEDTVGWANFTNAINQTGWSYLHVKTVGDFPDKIQAYAAGLLEGGLTYKLMELYWRNTVEHYCDGEMAEICKRTNSYLRANSKWVRGKIRRQFRDIRKRKNIVGSKGQECERSWRSKKLNINPYWHHVDLFYTQLQGLIKGYEEATVNSESGRLIPTGDILFMNIFGDMEDLSQALNMDGKVKNLTTHHLGVGRCSALIKLLPDDSDLYVAQDSWNSYQSMLRVLKKYTMRLHWTDSGCKKTTVPGETIAFSGYPGVIYSGDDFNIISPSGLVTLETTIGNSNKELWKYVQPTGQLLEGVRATVANRLAISGKHWSRIFSLHNSGTYNNQWMVVDYKKFKPGKKTKAAGILWVLEQLPGHVHMEDMTRVLTDQRYWPSYNVPYFKDIFQLSGAPANVAKYGDFFSYNKTARALIFRRDHGSVVDLSSMTRLMRYNNFREDPLSACPKCSPPYSAENAISARCDLNPANGTYPIAALGHRSHGGIDMKLVNVEMLSRMEFLAVSSPTFDDLPPFRWSQADFAKDCPHFGQPDLWNFPLIRHQWSSLP